MRFAAIVFAALLAATGGSFAAIYDHSGAAEYGAFLVYPDDPTVIILDGEISVLADFNLRRALMDYPDVRTLVLNSEGGSIDAALGMGDIIRSNGLATIIPAGAGCYSACALAYFAGSPRNVAGELGVHQFTTGGGSGDLATVADILDFAEAVGVPQAVVSIMLRTPPDDMHVFTADEIAKFGLNVGTVAAVVPGPEIADAPAVPAAETDNLRQEMLDLFDDPERIEEALRPLLADAPDYVYRAFVDYTVTLVGDPAYVDYTLAALDEVGARGATDEEFFVAGFGIGADMSSRGLIRLSAAEQREMFGYSERLLEWAAANRPRFCMVVMFGGNDPSELTAGLIDFLASLSAEDVARYFELSITASLAELHDDPPAPQLTAAEMDAAVAAYQEAIFTAVLAQPDAETMALALQSPNPDPELVCRFAVLTFSAVDLVDPAIRDDVFIAMLLAE